MRSKYNLCLFVGVAMLLLCNVNGQTVINNFHPTSGPVSGGTVIYVTGEGFITTGPTRSKCLFRDTSYGSLLSLENVIYNSTYLRCTMPEIYYLPSSVLVGGHYLSLSVTAGNGVQSNSASFFVFDLATIHVFSIYPSEGVNSSRTLISITGEGFLDTSEITCKVDSTDNTKINATFINGTFIQCVLLPYSTSARVHIEIAMNGQPSANLQPNTVNATVFTFFVTPPQIASCQFSSSYALLFLTFDREVEIGRESEYNTTHRPDCANIFSNLTQDLIGRDAICFWYNSQQRTIVIQLTANSRVEEGSVIMLKGDNVRTRSVEYSRLASGSISISLNREVLQPFPVLEAPGSIPYCGNFTLSAANSQHGGYRTLKYEWRIEKEIPATGDVIEDPSIVDSIPSGFTTQSTLTFPSDVFEENTTYTVQLTVRNFLNITATVTVNITKLPQPVPSVTIVGSQMKHVRSDKEIRLEGVAVLPECLNASGVVDYAWTIANQMGHEDLGNFTTRSAVLTLPPNSILPHSVHTATLAVSVREKVGSAVAILVTDLSDIRARINGGNHITVSDNDTIYLDGRVSEGLSTDITNDRLFSVSWTCMNTTELPATLPCLNQDGSPLNTSSTELVYTIPGATLQPGSYSFSLTLNYRGQQSTTYQMIVILPYHVPLVTPTPPLGLEAVPVHEKFTLRARIYSDFPGTAEWSTQPVVGYAQLELSPRVARTQLKYDILPNTEASLNETVHLLITANATSPPLTNQITLVLERGVLLADNSYRFRIEATNTQGHTGYAEIDIHTASVPLSGSFDIQQARGSPLDTRFSLRALWWTDDIGDMPLSYQFGFHYPQEQDVQWLNGLLDQNVISSVLPLPHWLNNSVNLVLQIYDNKGALTRHEASVVLEYNKNDSNNSIDIIRLMKTIERMSLVNGNWIEGLAHLTALTLSQHRYPNEFDPTELRIFKDRAINLLIELYRSYIPTSKSFLNQLLSLMFRVTFQLELTTNTVEQVLVILESVVDTYNSFGEMSVFSKPGFSEDEANLVFGTYANLITANSHRDSTRLVSDNITNSLLNVVPILGYGMCKQLGVGERNAFTFAENFGSLKSSQINPPRMYNASVTYEICPYKRNGTIYIDFTNRLFRRYLQWPCRTESESQCSGVCITSAQFRQDMRWQGSLYSSYAKAPFLHVSLANPANGSVLQIQDLQSSPVVISFPITSDPSNLNHLECVHWSKTLNAWSPQGCTTDITSPGVVTCACDHLSEFTVVEICPRGFFGANCTQVCPQGLWGEECLMECNCGGRGTCSPVNGACNCDPGWSGTRCETSCPAGSWGDSCAETCLCENQGQCYPVDGSCNCTPGWLGDYCNVSCPAGLYGDRCSGVCECRDISECSTITGQCNCQPGYSGITCHDECLEGFYGQNCSLECNCNLNGTMLCHHINGTCICQDQWMGVQCEFEITPQPSPSPTIHLPEPSFQIWWIVVPVLLMIVAVAITILAIVLWRRIKHHKQVLPITQDKKATGDGGRTGNEVAINGDDEFEITHAESYSVLIPKGSKLKDIFPKQNDEQVNFKEPPQLNGKQRWQIIQLLPEKDEREAGSRPPVELETPSPPKAEKKSSTTENTASEAGLDEGQANSVSDDNETITIEVIYKRGVYLDVDATMKDLRNGFIESNQLDAKDRIFQFLKSDVPGDYIEIDTEDEVMLAQIEHNLVQPKTFYIESLDPGSVQLELCTCGKFADLECTECHSRGYCSEKCQQDDWHRHTLTCQIISEKKRKKSKKARKKKRKKRKNIEGYTPSLTLCICGKETEFECSNCGLQGYCSEKCQLEDWSFHEYHCIKPPTTATPPRRRERPLTTIEEVPESEEVSTQSEFMLAATPNVIQKQVT